MPGTGREPSVDTDSTLCDRLASDEAPNGASGAEDTLDLGRRFAELQTCYRLASIAANSFTRSAGASEEIGNALRRPARLIDYANQALSRSMALPSEVARATFLHIQGNVLRTQCDIFRSQVVGSENTQRAVSAIDLAGRRAGGSFWNGVPLDAHTVNLYTDSIALCLESVQEGLSAPDAAALTLEVHKWEPPSTIDFQLATSRDVSGKSVQDIASSLSSLIESSYIMGLAFRRERQADPPLTQYETDLLEEERITQPTCPEMADHATIIGVNVQFLGGASEI